MIHHVVLGVSELERSGSFYDALLAPLGWRRHYDQEGMVGWGIAKPVFFIAAQAGTTAGSGLISFSAPGIAAVKAAWDGGTRAGGAGVSGPGEVKRPGSGSYSAFLADPDGHNIEVTVGAE